MLLYQSFSGDFDLTISNPVIACQINIWFTGHSLGCSTATLVYAQLLNTPENKYMQFRDAYLFAAPIVCDRESVDSECTESLLYSHTTN